MLRLFYSGRTVRLRIRLAHLLQPPFQDPRHEKPRHNWPQMPRRCCRCLKIKWKRCVQHRAEPSRIQRHRTVKSELRSGELGHRTERRSSKIPSRERERAGQIHHDFLGTGFVGVVSEQQYQTAREMDGTAEFGAAGIRSCATLSGQIKHHQAQAKHFDKK